MRTFRSLSKRSCIRQDSGERAYPTPSIQGSILGDVRMYNTSGRYCLRLVLVYMGVPELLLASIRMDGLDTLYTVCFRMYDVVTRL